MFFEEDHSQRIIYWDSRSILVNYDEDNFLLHESSTEYNSPASPLEFPSPIGIGRAVRQTSNVLDPDTMEVISRQTIIYSKPKKTDGIPRKAYYLIKKIGDNIHGQSHLCRILKRSRRRLTDPLHQSNKESNVISSTRGKSSRSYGWYWEITPEIAVLKFSSWSRMYRNRGRHLSEPIKELCAMQLLGNYHDHVLATLEAMDDDHGLYLFTPYCHGGDLYGDMMIRFRETNICFLTETQARYWFRQVLLGLYHLQRKGLCHRKISLENLMIHDGKIKIINFDLCLRVPYSDPANEGYVTDVSQGKTRRLMKAQGQGSSSWRYTAPEIISRDNFDGFATDLWSAGIILYIMLVGTFPFQSALRVDYNFLQYSVVGALEKILRSGSSTISTEACNLLQNMLWENPAKRLSLIQVMEHPWVRNDISKSNFE